jgi:hypothetical protein
VALLETGQPAAVKRGEVLNLLRSLGLDPNLITAQGVRICTDSIECTVVATDAQGGLIVDQANDRVATNVIHIPIVDD